MGKNKLIIKQKEEIKPEEVKEELKENTEVKEQSENKKKQSKIFTLTADTIKGIAEGRKLVYILERENLPFLFYMTFLGILYISNTYYASGTLRQMEKVKNQIRELRYEYVNTEKQLIELSRRNKVMERLKYDNKELKESKVPPYQLTINNLQ
jgi:hypothetical protein